MIEKFDLWKYSDESNCWDFVVAYLSDVGVHLPRFGICPSNKLGMTRASKSVIKDHLVECGPMDYAIACHYHGKLLIHVGIVHNGQVRHAHHANGVRRNTIKEFEGMAQKTIYKIPKCLI